MSSSLESEFTSSCFEVKGTSLVGSSVCHGCWVSTGSSTVAAAAMAMVFQPPSRFLFCGHVSCLEPRQRVLGVLDATTVGLPRGCRATSAIVLRFSTFLLQHSIKTHVSRRMPERLPYDCRKTNLRND